MSTAPKVSVVGRVEHRRRLALETLEHRLLLAIGPAPIDSAQQQCLEDGLDGLVVWADTLDRHGATAQPLPVVGLSLGQSLDLSDILDQGLVTPVKNYFLADPTPTTDELVSTLQGLGGSFGNLTITVPGTVTGGLDDQGGYQELVFSLVFQGDRSLSTGISLGPKGDDLGFAFDPAISVALSTRTSLDFSFGMDLGAGLDPEDAFFVRVNGLDASADASGTGLSGAMNVGFYDAQLTSGSLSLDADLDVTLNNPDSDPHGSITLEELQATGLSSLVTLTPSGSASGSLSVSASSFAGFDPSSLAPVVTFSSGNPFVAPDLSFNSDFDELLNFTNLNSHAMLGVVNQLGTWLDGLRTTTVLDDALCLAAGTTLGDVLELGDMLADPQNGLNGLLRDTQGAPIFDSAQTLVTALASVPGLTLGAVAYNPTTNELSYHLTLAWTFGTATRPFGIDLDLSPLGSLSSSSTVAVETGATLEFTLGVDLSGYQAELVAEADGPANGQLGADAVFSLAVGTAPPVAVTVSKTDTDLNTNLDDLVGDFNTALVVAGLGNTVTAGRSGNRLTLTTAGRVVPAMLQLTASTGNPILTEVHFRNSQLALDSVDRCSFVEQASVSGMVSVEADPIDATADLGFLEVSITGGSGLAHLAVDLQLEDPVTHTPGARLYLADLFDALAGDITSVVDGPNLTGQLDDLTLPLAVTPNVFGASHPVDPELVVTWPDITDINTLDLQFNNADLLLDFENVSGPGIAGAFGDLADYFAVVESLALAAQRIPGLDHSMGQVVAFAERFEELVADLAAAPARVLQQLESTIEQAFGLSDPAVEVTLEENNTVIKLGIILGYTLQDSYPVDVDLESLGVGDFGHLVDFRGSALVAVDAQAALELVFGIDVTNPLDPRPFVYDTTGLVLSAFSAATGIEFTTAIGPLGVWIKQGSVMLDGDGDPNTVDAVELAVGLNDNDTDHKIYLSELSSSHAAPSLVGQLHATFPLFFPTATSYLGNIDLDIGNLADIDNPATTNISTPPFEAAFGEFDLLNNLGVVVDGVDYVLSQVESALTSKFVQVNLPMIGDELADLSGFIGDIRDNVIREIQNRFAEALNRTPVVVQNALFDALGPDGLDILVDANSSGTVTRDDIGVVLTDTDDDGQEDDQIDILLSIGRSYTLVDEPVDFDLGIPALGLDVDGDLELKLGFQWNVAMGIDRDLGFYLDTSQIDELTVYLQAGISDLHAEGRLWFFQLDVTDEDADSDPNNDGVDVDSDTLLPSAVALAVTVDLLDPRDDPNTPLDDNKLTFGDLTAGGYGLDDMVDVAVVGGADVNLNLLLSYKGDARFPSIAADFALGWQFQTGGLGGEAPTVAFNNVRLNVGQWVADFAAPILKKIQKFTEPMQPVVDFLTTPVPIMDDLGLEVTPLEIAEAMGYGDIADYVEAVAGIITIVNSIPAVDGDLYVPLGSFDLAGVDPRDPEQMAGADPNVKDDPPVDPPTQLASVSPEASGFYTQMHNQGISLPILESPLSVFKLLLGQDVDLITYDLPELTLDFPFPIIKIPIYAGVWIAFSGRVEAGVDLKFGYDTHGFHKYQETGDWWDVFSGFYVSDRQNADGTGPEVPEGFLRGTINGGVEVGVVLVSAGVSAGVTLGLYADLADPDADGKVHVDELLANLDLGLLTTFDVSGDIRAHLDAYIEVLGQRVWEYQIAEYKIEDFVLTEPQIYHDRHTGNDGGHVSSTWLGAAPGLHVDGLSLESAADEDWYGFELLRPDSIDVDVRFSGVRGDVNITVYDQTGTNELGQSFSDQDREVVSLVELPAGTYYAKVTGAGQLNNYMFCVEPGETSTTRVIYVNPEGKEDRSDSFYTVEPGDDDNDGLVYRKPKASLADVLATYDLGPNDLVVFDTGEHAALAATIHAEDEGATYVGTPLGSIVSDITLSGSDNSRFYSLSLSEGGTGLTIEGDSSGNVVHYCTISENDTGLRIDSVQYNRVEHNVVADNAIVGIYLSPATTSTVRYNEVLGNGIGIYNDSRVADEHANDVHGNAVGLSSRQGILGPDNPPPYGTAGGTQPDDVWDNTTGVQIPDDACGVIVRFLPIHENDVGILQLGDDSLIIANNIYQNATGIEGTQVIGPGDWGSELHNLVHDNGVGVCALAGAEVRYNRIYANTTGIAVEGNALVHHNLIYRNSGHGVLLAGADDYEDRNTEGARNVEVVNNTIYAPAGNGIHLEGFVSAVALRHNIVWAQSGYALYVQDKSQFGYTSDYNNFYTGGSGHVAFQGKDFDDLYDWQVEAEQDLHSIGYTVVDPWRDDPRFVNQGDDDYHLQAGSTSIDAGAPLNPADPFTSFALEPGTNGNRVNLGAYGNTPEAAASTDRWLRLTSPCYYADLVPSETYTIAWQTYNVPDGDALDIDLMLEGGGKVADVNVVTVGAGLVTWTPGNFVSSPNRTDRFRIQVVTSGTTSLTVSSREAFSIPPLDPAADNIFYIDDRDPANTFDEYTPSAAGDNRNTGTSALDPKVVIRPIVLSYALDAGDIVRVDTGSYVHAVNLNLGGGFLAFDPRMNTVFGTLITGPTDPNKIATIDRANKHPGSVAIDLIDSDDMTIHNLDVRRAEIGVRVRQDSRDFSADHLAVEDHALDGIAIEGGSDGAILDYCTAAGNGRHGIFVDSLLTRITYGNVHDNSQIGIALRSVGAAVVENGTVYANQTGIDVINPGSGQAVIGHSDLGQNRGNIVRNNRQDGIFAAGSVLVGCNNVYDNGRTGIRLDDGADALRNVVHSHVTGISALGSTSDIVENRVCNNSESGILASFASQVLRNVVYTNGRYGIHVDRFSGLIDHNLVYEDDDKSIWVEGPGAGAQLINNTVYEPCAGEEPEKTTVEFEWEWMIGMQQFDPLLAFDVALKGAARIQYAPPIGLGEGGTFELGPGGGIDAVTPEPVPPGQWWQVDTQIVSLELDSVVATPLGPLEVHLREDQSSTGQILVNSEGGFLTGESFFDVFVFFVFPNEELTLFEKSPMRVGWSFDATSGLGDCQVLQAPLTLTESTSAVELGILPTFPPPDPWGAWHFYSGAPLPSTTPPQDPGRYCAEIGIHVSTQSAHVLLRNNAVYVGGCPAPPPGLEGHDIVVEADSTTGWQSDFNIFTTSNGYIGRWAGVEAPTMTNWQNTSGDDPFSIDPPWWTIWVDPDGSDNLLGFRGAGSSDGRDDNLHLRSPFHEVAQGALAPVADPNQLPSMQPVVWQSDLPPLDPTQLSPGVDWGDPAYDYSAEPMENGKFINLGCYGNTAQASESEPEYVHIVYPLGLEELVFGQTYQIQWRTQDSASQVSIELRHGSATGGLELTIATGIANTGSYPWTVPALPPPNVGSDYVIVVRQPKTPPQQDVVGASRRQFSINTADTVPPEVVQVSPQQVDYELPTNAPPAAITLVFSENLPAGSGGNPAGYELIEAGSGGVFDDGNDVPFVLTPVYTPGAYDSDCSTVVLNIAAAPLPPGRYRLTAGRGILSDAAGNVLDGDGDGTAGGGYVRQFTVDQTPPTVSITSVGASPRNCSVDSITIVYSEAARGLGLADLRLTRGPDGSNLLTEEHLLTTSDGVTWTLPNLAGVTAAEGNYTLQLTSANGDICDLAGNPLGADASTTWSTDVTPPSVQIRAVLPDPRGAVVSDITLVFSERVANFELADLLLTRDGGAVSFTGAQTLSTVDFITWKLDGLATLTGADGSYALSLDADASGVTDQAGIALAGSAREIWRMDTTPPEADVLDLVPDPRNAAVDEILIAFNEAVSGLDLADLSLTRDGGPNLLTGSQSVSTVDGMHWRLDGLSGLTDLAGQYVLTLTAAGSDIADRSGNLLAQDAVDSWLVDVTPPTASITAVSPDPHNAAVSSITISFSEPVTGLDPADLILTLDCGPNLLSPAQAVSTSNNIDWVLTGLASLTAPDGQYRLTLAAASSGIQDSAGNPLAADATESWRMDATAPSVDILDVTPDPCAAPVDQLTIVLSEPVDELDLGDLVLLRNEGSNLLPGTATLTTVDHVTWTLGNLSDMTRPPGEYALLLASPGSQIADPAGNPLPHGTTETWLNTLAAEVAGRHIFYNNCKWDGHAGYLNGDPAANQYDDNAIATDKFALLPNGTGALVNYTSYLKGINGVMIDVDGLPGDVTAADFQFLVGNSNNLATWTPAPAPASVTVRPGAGTGGSDRITITWADSDIRKMWLQVTVLAANTGLSEDDVHFWGNQVGETGNNPANTRVDAGDASAVRAHYSGLGTAGVTSLYDINRDKRVDAGDFSAIRANYTGLSASLIYLVAPPPYPAALSVGTPTIEPGELVGLRPPISRLETDTPLIEDGLVCEVPPTACDLVPPYVEQRGLSAQVRAMAMARVATSREAIRAAALQSKLVDRLLPSARHLEEELLDLLARIHRRRRE